MFISKDKTKIKDIVFSCHTSVRQKQQSIGPTVFFREDGLDHNSTDDNMTPNVFDLLVRLNIEHIILVKEEVCSFTRV